MFSPPGALRPKNGTVLRALVPRTFEPWAREATVLVCGRPTSAQFTVWKFPAYAPSWRCDRTHSGLEAEQGFLIGPIGG